MKSSVDKQIRSAAMYKPRGGNLKTRKFNQGTLRRVGGTKNTPTLYPVEG